MLANGEEIRLDGVTTLTFKLGRLQVSAPFWVADINNHALLGLNFFQEHDSSIDFKTCQFQCDGIKVSCCSKEGEPLQVGVQARHASRIPPQTELVIQARLNRVWVHGAGCIETTQAAPGVVVASSLHRPNGQLLPIRVMNYSDHPVTIPAGKRIAVCTAVQAIESLDMATPAIPDKNWEDIVCRWCEGLDQEGSVKARNLLSKHHAVFSREKFDLGRTDVVQHDINLNTGARPIKQRPYRHGPVQEEEIEKQVEELKAHGLVKEGHGAWSSPVVLVKKRDGSWRFCVDYRKLNEVTQKDAYPLPRIDDSLDALGGSRLFSTLDLTSGYWQVGLAKGAREKAAFATRSGLWEWQVLPFGLTSAPSTFERLMERVLRGLHWRTLLIYLDDIIVFSKDLDSHLSRLEEVFTRLKAAGLKLKPSKCTLFAKQVNYLGHVVSADGVATDQEKVAAVRNWPVPQHKTDVRAFLGTCGYYRRFIAGFSELQRPLSQLCKREAKFRWDENCQRAFDILKEKLTSAPILAYPDYTLPFILDTDASQVGTGAVLSQKQKEGEKVVAYYSKMFSPEEMNYCVTRKELLAIVKAVNHFRPQLYGRKFEIRTDHASLLWLLRTSVPTGQLARWMETLSEFDFSLTHRSGRKHNNADGLSRQECQDCKQCARLTGEIKLSALDNPEIQESKITSEQLADPHIGPVLQAVKSSGAIDEKHASAETLKLWSRKEFLEIGPNGALQIKLPDGRHRSHQTVCPQERRLPIMTENHNQAHLGVNKTLLAIRRQWYWPGMTGDIRRFVASCTACQQAKVARHRHFHPKNHLTAGRPWQVVAVDLCGPLPETEAGNTQILVLADHFTRWYDAIPIKDGKASTVAKILDERVFSYFGIPETLHSDQGAQFQSQLLAECCKLWNCTKTKTAPYHPQGNSVVERLNRTVGNSLRALLRDSEHREWDELLPQIMRTLRATPHRMTEETPNYLMLGRETRLPPDLLHEGREESVLQEDYAQQLQERLQIAGEKLRRKQLMPRVSDSEEPSKYMVGDKVWLKSFYKPTGRGQKLQPKYIGPYHITAVLPYQSYEMSRNGKLSVQHEGRIRLWQGGEQSQMEETPAQSDTNEDTQESHDIGRQVASAVQRQQVWKSPRGKRKSRRPRYLDEFHLDLCKAQEMFPVDKEVAILGQNSVLVGGSEVNAHSQMNNTLVQGGGPEKGPLGENQLETIGYSPSRSRGSGQIAKTTRFGGALELAC